MCVCPLQVVLKTAYGRALESQGAVRAPQSVSEQLPTKREPERKEPEPHQAAQQPSQEQGLSTQKLAQSRRTFTGRYGQGASREAVPQRSTIQATTDTGGRKHAPLSMDMPRSTNSRATQEAQSHAV
jgi:hypothetical protein